MNANERWAGYGVATASWLAEGSGKDRESFGFDFWIVAAVILPPWRPLPGPGPNKLQSSVIQLLPLQFCQRAHRWVIPVFSLPTEGLMSCKTHFWFCFLFFLCVCVCEVGACIMLLLWLILRSIRSEGLGPRNIPSFWHSSRSNNKRLKSSWHQLYHYLINAMSR